MADGYQAALQLAVLTALKADAGLGALVGNRIYDAPPQSVLFPYVRFGRSEFAPDDTDGTLGGVVDFAIVVHTDPPQYRPENSNIQQAIVDALHRSEEELPVAGYSLDTLEFLTSSTTKDGGKGRWVGRVAFQAKLQPNVT
jgi:Protein of unknown function (DUF3168)